MKREELLEKGYTEEQVTDILNTFHGINKENEKLKSEILEKADLENKYNEAQKALDEINKANMTKEEQIAAKEKQIEENLRQSQITLNKSRAKDVLAGYDIDDAILETLVTADEQTTLKNVNLLKTKFDAFKDTVEKQTKASIANMDVKPNPTNVPQDDDVMTKEKFDKMTMTEQKAWKDANLDQYHEFYPQK